MIVGKAGRNRRYNGAKIVNPSRLRNNVAKKRAARFFRQLFFRTFK